MKKLGVCTPSRGMMHSRTVEAVLSNIQAVQGYDWRWFFSHDLPIPDCFNDTVARAYDWGADLVWIVEDDVQPPPDTLGQLLVAINAGADVGVSDYLMEALPDKDRLEWGVCQDGADRVTWCRTGCILFKRECLDALPRPWFGLSTRLVKTGAVTWDEGEDRGYGADIPFTNELHQLGAEFTVIDITCKHLRVIEWGNERGNNSGYHRIAALGGNEWQESMEQMEQSKSGQPLTAP